MRPFNFRSYVVAAIGVVSAILITRLPTRYFGPNYLGPFEFMPQFLAFFVPIGIVSFSAASLLVKGFTKELTVAERYVYFFYIVTNLIPIIALLIKRFWILTGVGLS